LPAVSTAQKYGLRSIDHVGELIGDTGLPRRHHREVGVQRPAVAVRSSDTQLSKPSSFALLLTASSDEYLGMNCFR